MLITNNKVYDSLKWVAMVLLPAIGTLYFALAQIWQFGYGTEVVGSITTVDTFLGVLLHVSNSTYDQTYDGHITVDAAGAGVLNVDPAAIASKDEVKLQVNKAS